MFKKFPAFYEPKDSVPPSQEPAGIQSSVENNMKCCVQ